MPALVNINVGSWRGTRGLEATTWWSLRAKKSRKPARMAFTPAWLTLVPPTLVPPVVVPGALVPEVLAPAALGPVLLLASSLPPLAVAAPLSDSVSRARAVAVCLAPAPRLRAAASLSFTDASFTDVMAAKREILVGHEAHWRPVRSEPRRAPITLLVLEQRPLTDRVRHRMGKGGCPAAGRPSIRNFAAF